MEQNIDSTLVEQSRGGDTQAFAALVSRYQNVVCATAYAVVRDAALSEDVAQDAFVEGWRRLDQLREPRNVRAWLCSIARSRGLDALRKRKRLQRANETLVASSSVSTIDQLETAKLVSAALMEIPDGCREAVILFYREERSLREVARALGISEDAAKQRVSRGRKYLRAELESMIDDVLVRTKPDSRFCFAVLGAIRLRAPVADQPRADLYGAERQGAAPKIGALSRVASVLVRTELIAGMVLGILLLVGAAMTFMSSPFAVADSEAPFRGPQVLGTVQADSSGAATRSYGAAPSAGGSPYAQTQRLTGRVLTSKGTPCAYESVVLSQTTLDEQLTADERVVAFAYTDTGGRFAFSGLEVGKYFVRLVCKAQRSGHLVREAGTGELSLQYPEDDGRDWVVTVPSDWKSSEPSEEAPKDVARWLREVQVAPLREERIARETTDVDGDGEVSDEEHALEQETTSQFLTRRKRMGAYVMSRFADDAVVSIPFSGQLRDGPRDAPIKFVQVVSLSCVACLKSREVLKELRGNYPEQMRVETHVRVGDDASFVGARALCAATEQGRARAFYDAVMDEAAGGQEPTESSVRAIARRINLNQARFNAAFSGSACHKAVETHSKRLDALEFKSMPTWIINGHVFTGVSPIQVYRAFIEGELAGNGPRKDTP